MEFYIGYILVILCF